jgi:xanthine dehydrogenase YagR molybdenum-binding subunit
MTGLLPARAIGAPVARIDGPAKVTGSAPYAFEYRLGRPAYAHLVQATVARGRITAIDTAAALALDGVLFVLTHQNAPRLASDHDRELWVLQSGQVWFRGQVIGVVVADSIEIAREAARLVRVEYQAEHHDVRLRADSGDLYTPERVNPELVTDTADGDVAAALAAAPVTVDETYTTPPEYHNPIEPHTTAAIWGGDGDAGHLTVYDSNQGASRIQAELALVFGLDPGQVTVISPFVGGAFGSKTRAKAHQVVAVLAAKRAAGRPVKLALSRRQMFAGAGYRTPTIQRVQLGAHRDGKLIAIAHDAIAQTARFKEFAEQTALGTRTMYAAPHRRTTHRLAALDVAVPTVMRAPGEAPGMFALESAIDELAVACGLDPVEIRLRNEPSLDPETGLPYSTRNLPACLHEGMRRFDWARRDPVPGTRLTNGWLAGTGVAAATYPVYPRPGGSRATIRTIGGGRYQVQIGAADIGTGAWTILTQIAADALEVPLSMIEVQLGDSTLPAATPAAGAMGTSNWGSAITAAARAFRAQHGNQPGPGAEATATDPDNPSAGKVAMHAFGAQFAEVHVHADTREIRVPRLLGVFAIGRVINPRTARSQLIGGMTMGLSMALHEEGVTDPRLGHVINSDLAGYHIASHADAQDIEATWIDEHDPHYNPMGAKGAGEIGIVGVAAAIANAIHHATGIRIRELPITIDKLLAYRLERAAIRSGTPGKERHNPVMGLATTQAFPVPIMSRSNPQGLPCLFRRARRVATNMRRAAGVSGPRASRHAIAPRL